MHPLLVQWVRSLRRSHWAKIGVGGLCSFLEALVAGILLCFPPSRSSSRSLAHEIFLLLLKRAMEDWVLLIVCILTYSAAFIFHHDLDWFHPENLEKFFIPTFITSAKYLCHEMQHSHSFQILGHGCTGGTLFCQSQ